MFFESNRIWIQTKEQELDGKKRLLENNKAKEVEKKD